MYECVSVVVLDSPLAMFDEYLCSSFIYKVKKFIVKVYLGNPEHL